jgi:predicted MFS family arabinose efflux permease
VYGISRAGTNGWGDSWTVLSLAAGLVLLAVFLVLERRVEHPLLPVRVFVNRTRAASFVAMFFAPAAMFAMFFYLSQYIQTVMGYSPIKAGVAFLPFCVGLVVAAGIASNLVSRIDPRYLAGVGTLMAAAALFGFSRLPNDTTLPIQDVTGSYWTDLLPYIVLMSVGMGLVFVPLTLTAVHHLRAEDSGIGSGVLNTMQQVGGALGLSLLGTIATQTMDDLGVDLTKAAQQAGLAAGPIPAAVQHQIFTAGASDAFLLGAGLMLVASLVTWIFLNVKHEELATDGPEAPVHVG